MVVWLAASVAPFVVVAWHLATVALADVPEAYLVCIPATAFPWSVWRLHAARVTPARADSAWPRAVGIAMMAAVLVLALVAPRSLVEASALALWPVWAAGVLLVLAGPKALGAAWLPLVYLFLAWPPPYLALVALADPALVQATYGVLHRLAGSFAWMHPLGALPARIGVSTPKGSIVVDVTAACSGADSILALLVLLPVAMSLFRTTLWRRLLLLVGGCLVAFVGNVIRLTLVMAAAHLVSAAFAFDVVHPLLGPVLFAGLTLALLSAAGRIRTLPPQRPATTRALDRATFAWVAAASCAVLVALAL